MPHPAVATPCDPDCACGGCLPCLSAVVCDPDNPGLTIPVGCRFSVFGPLAGEESDPDCAGDPIAIGHADAGESVCLSVPEEGWYSLFTEPDPDSGARGDCRRIFVQCPSPGPSVVQLGPETYDVEITVIGCLGYAGFPPDLVVCSTEGTDVEYSDGVNTVSGTIAPGEHKITFTGLDGVPPDTPYSWTATPPADCGWGVLSVTGTLDVESTCRAIFQGDLPVASGFDCMAGVAGRPLPLSLAFTHTLGIACTLESDGWYSGGLGVVAAAWKACTTMTVPGASPADCGPSEGDCDQFRYQAGSVAVPVVVYLILTGSCGSMLSYQLAIGYFTTRLGCGPVIFDPPKPIGSIWMVPGTGPPFVARDVSCCDPGSGGGTYGVGLCVGEPGETIACQGSESDATGIHTDNEEGSIGIACGDTSIVRSYWTASW